MQPVLAVFDTCTCAAEATQLGCKRLDEKLGELGSDPESRATAKHTKDRQTPSQERVTCRRAAQPRAAACSRSAAAVCSAYRLAARLNSRIARCTCTAAAYLVQDTRLPSELGVVTFCRLLPTDVAQNCTG